jgi:hypothetical protein
MHQGKKYLEVHLKIAKAMFVVTREFEGRPKFHPRFAPLQS